jgi:hypothetical protein
MRKLVGISQKIKRAWLDAVLDQLVQTTNEVELRTFLDKRLNDELPGKESRAKTAGIILRIWSGIPPERVHLRDRAVALLPQISGQERIWLHWGMTSLAYPFFRDAAEVVGRLLSLQDDFTTAQVQARMVKAWGDRVTSMEAVQKLMHTLVDWEMLRTTQTKGQFLLARKATASILDLQLWLLEALLGASAADEIEAQQFLRSPESFPFTISVEIADLRRYEGFNIHRQGLDMDMVSVRPVKFAVPAKTTKEKTAKKPKDASTSLFRESSEESPKKAVAQPIIRQVAEVFSFSIEEPTTKPEPSSASTIVQPVEAQVPEPVGTPTVSALVRTDRLATVEDLDLPHEVPFSAPIVECVGLFHKGLDFACIALAHDTIDAILRLVCRVKLGTRQAKCADIRSQFAGLTAIGVLPTAMKTRVEKLWYERVSYLELSTSEAFDRSTLEEVASSHISVLIDLLRHFLGHSLDQGRALPAHPEYWNHGKSKLPLKAGATG